MQDKCLIWVITGDHVGDNAQVLHAANALELNFVQKHIVVQSRYAGVPLPVEPAISHVDWQHSDELVGPWPDLCLVIGRRLSMVALWIKQESKGKTKLVIFNPPKGSVDKFDLVILPSIYRWQSTPRICHISFPLSFISKQHPLIDTNALSSVLDGMQKPVTALLVGGDFGRRRMKPEKMKAILKGFQKDQGSVVVITSRRTSSEVVSVLDDGLRSKDRLYRWHQKDEYNPYREVVLSADFIAVTDESMSMMTEVSRLGKPMIIVEISGGWLWLSHLLDLIGLGKLKDLNRAKRKLFERNVASKFGKKPNLSPKPIPDETKRVVEAILDLIVA